MVIACTQPRRVAATSVATRVAQEVGTILGDEVGYTIRFEDLSSPTRTRIKYLTDGMLFREVEYHVNASGKAIANESVDYQCMLDPLLSKYSVVMVDEAHERSSYTDLLLGLLKKIRRKRPELRLIISSATIDAQAFLNYFNSNTGFDTEEAAILALEGRMYPVEVGYLAEPTLDYVETAVQAVFDLHLNVSRA
jgi:ATP-dependent RNA helicase DDX35